MQESDLLSKAHRDPFFWVNYGLVIRQSSNMGYPARLRVAGNIVFCLN